MEIKLIFLLLISLYFVQSKLEPLDISLFFDHKKDYNNQKEIKAFHAKPTDHARYIKIIVTGKELNPDTNHIISFYGKDTTFTDRKQLAQSSTGKTVMILYNPQFVWDFYFTVECAKTPCSYQLIVFRYYNRNVGLYVGEQFNYYVTKENTQMSFTIDTINDIKSRSGNYIIALWVKGNKKIQHELKNNWVHSSDYGYYYINIDDYKKSNHELTVIGEIGDFISISSLLYQKKYLEYISINKFVCNGFEVSGYLDDTFEKFSYGHNKTFNNLGLPYSLNNNFNKIKYVKNVENNENYYVEQISAEEKSFFSFQFINSTKYDGEGNNKYMPQLLGVYYPRLIEEGTIIGLIPVSPGENFTFLTYLTLPIKGEIEVSIFECNNYPLCQTDDSNNSSFKKVHEGYKSYYAFFNNKEYGDISPVTKKQKMLMIKCIKGTNIGQLKNVCKIISLMKTEKESIFYNKINLYNPSLYNFIKKNEKIHYLIQKTNKLIYLNIEIITGNIEISINTTNEYYENGNKRLYIFSGDENINIIIKGRKDSVYSLYDYYDNIIQNSIIPIGLNYLLNIKNRLMFKPADYFNSSFNKNNLYYFGIHSLGCNMNIITDDNTFIDKNIGFVQHIINLNTTDRHYLLTNTNKSSFCLCYASFYELDNKYGITLANNVSQLFTFNKNVKKLSFSYPHIEKHEDVSISLIFSNEAKYLIKIYLNNKYINKAYTNSSQQLVLFSAIIKSKCPNFVTVCTIFMTVESLNNQKDSIIEIGINNSKNSNIPETSIFPEKSSHSDEPFNNKTDPNSNSNSSSSNTSSKNNTSEADIAPNNPGNQKPNSGASQNNNSNNNNNNINSNNNNNNNNNYNKNNDKKFIIIIISISVVSFIIICILVICLIKVYNMKAKDLNEKINKVSFQDENLIN